MAKRKGLPDGFDIRVPEGPVELGDYLDETAPPAAAAAPPPVVARPMTAPRKQVNMTPETLRMVDELLTHLRLYSQERDVRASELFHALVLAVWEVREQLDLSPVQPRGKWGSPTAMALPVALKNSFQRAIIRARS
jgi:hypothetical protein